MGLPLWVDLRQVPVNKRLPYLHAVADAGVERVVLAKEDPHHEREGLRTAWVDAKGTIKEGRRAIGRWLRVADGPP
jgi:hypothetical protein